VANPTFRSGAPATRGIRVYMTEPFSISTFIKSFIVPGAVGGLEARKSRWSYRGRAGSRGPLARAGVSLASRSEPSGLPRVGPSSVECQDHAVCVAKNTAMLSKGLYCPGLLLSR
jgi:hypothetical protein